MFENIEVYAGSRAMTQIMDGGLKPDMIKAMAGAAGGPKFLVLSGLDRAIIGTFLKGRTEPLFYIGSSIGVFRAAALAQENPLGAHSKLIESYMKQSYSPKPTAEDISSETEKILDSYIKEADIKYILNKSFINISMITTRCTGLSSSDSKLLQGTSLIAASAANLLSRQLLLKIYDRVLLYDKRNEPPFIGHVKNEKYRIGLTMKNFRQSVLASGSIPMAMKGVTSIDGAPKGTYRDGGLSDYHMDIDFGVRDGIVLYPHFFNSITPGWLDKSIKWRKPKSENFSNTLLICPSEKLIKKLPNGRVTDRKDFLTYAGDDRGRITAWKEAVKTSERCGEDFLDAAAGGQIKRIVKPFIG